jgi:hypothetical protein
MAVLVLALGLGLAHADGVLQPGFDQFFLEDVDGRTRAWGLAVADFTSDGTADVISGDTFGDVHLFAGVGDGTFEDRGVVINMAFHDAYALVAADFDRDGFQDFVLSRTRGSSAPAEDGELLLYLGNGDGTFQSAGFPQRGELVGDAGTDPVSLAAADVDDDGDVDLVSGDVAESENGLADVILFRNQLEVLGGALTFVPETLIQGVDRGFSPDPEEPPYFPPTVYLHGYGLAFGDMDGDGDQDLLVSDRANYLYVYANDGSGSFDPIRFETISTRPYAYDRLHANFTFQMPLAAGDLNGDALVDFATAVQTGDDGDYPGQVEAWLNEGLDDSGRPVFTNGGIVGSAGSDARGLAVGQLNPADDLTLDIAFGNFEGDVHGLFADLTDSDGDGIIDTFDNAPETFNPPVVDMNADGAINRLDQLDNDHDGVGDPADADDDNDQWEDGEDNCPLTPNPDQADFDGDGRGDACDPLNEVDSDEDGIFDGPVDPDLAAEALEANARWARADTRFVIRIDALSRAFQNEFTQTMTDGAILTPTAWEEKKNDSYNGIGDAPAEDGYAVPEDLEGGVDVPISLVTIPKKLFDAFGDPDPIRWVNDRNELGNLEIAQHGTYHANNTPLGDWGTQPDRNFYSCETCGLERDTVYQLLRVGKRTLLGDYGVDPWILDSGVDPDDGAKIDWSDSANPLFGYAPPFNASDTPSRDATSRLGFGSFSASIFEEESPIFTPEGSHHERFDQFGMFHPSADLQVDPETPDGGSYEAYLESITEWEGLNTWLIEEVEWSTRYCNDLPRLEPCPEAPGGINRENNMIDPERWERWLTLLRFAKDNGVVLTMSQVALAKATDNCVGLPNPDQADQDADGRGNVCDVDEIDIKPGSDRNPINPRSRGVIPVATLGSEFLDVSNIDFDTLRFGPAGAPPAHKHGHYEDVNDDGYTDLVTHHRTQETGIEDGDTEACLEGVIGDTPFVACDHITTVPSRMGRGRPDRAHGPAANERWTHRLRERRGEHR